ncbi:hypothetical protein VE04_03526 [Pseudogymnoascus sp. 24MN13]|nr:hypothetical protein VE04_03526 [Pseudogymnoascus sp. 24MN13]
MLHSAPIAVVIYKPHELFVIPNIHFWRASKDSGELLAKVEIFTDESFGTGASIEKLLTERAAHKGAKTTAIAKYKSADKVRLGVELEIMKEELAKAIEKQEGGGLEGAMTKQSPFRQ